MDYKEAVDEVRRIKEKLLAEGHAEAAKLVEAYHVLFGDAAKVEAEVKADAETVAHDAVAAEAPVVNEAVQDVAAVADHAATGTTAETTKQ